MSRPRLNQALLSSLHGIDTPSYDRDSLPAGILHIGVGAFHRAHQAVYTDDVLNAEGGNWGIIGASLHNPTAEQQLAPQDGLYTVSELTPGVVKRRVIGAMTRVITASDPAGFKQLMSTIANPHIHIVTLTVTEKGYCHTGGKLDIQHPDVAQDLSADTRKLSLPGVLAMGLDARRRAGCGPITLISCDNLNANGRVLSNVVTEFAARYNSDLENWISVNVRFPNTMVDRIVPATSDGDRTRIVEELGFSDEATVLCEPFRQWVIEDNFAGLRPLWEKAGALLVKDVSLYEQAKLRLLNGPHSACAYLGRLQGYNYIHEVMQNPGLRAFVSRLVSEEILPTVTTLPDLDLNTYTDSIFRRFANSSVAYGTHQVGADGSQKLPQRLLPVAKERLAAGQTIDRLALVFAAWIEHLQDPAPDPLADRLQALYRKHEDADRLVDAIYQATPIFASVEGYAAVFTRAVSSALRLLRRRGLQAALAETA